MTVTKCRPRRISGKYALNWTRLSCHDFVDNQVRLQLFALAYNLGNFLRRLALPKKIREWSLRTLQVKLIKIGAKVVRHSRYVIFQMAEVAVPQIHFREIFDRIRQLRFLTIPARPASKLGWSIGSSFKKLWTKTCFISEVPSSLL